MWQSSFCSSKQQNASPAPHMAVRRYKLCFLVMHINKEWYRFCLLAIWVFNLFWYFCPPFISLGASKLWEGLVVLFWDNGLYVSGITNPFCLTHCVWIIMASILGPKIACFLFNCRCCKLRTVAEADPSNDLSRILANTQFGNS